MATSDSAHATGALQYKPIYGNYRGYYQSKRPTTSLSTSSIDPRLTLLPNLEAFFKERRVLDVGCNEGWVTCEIAQRFNPQHIVGVDIDSELIRSAWKKRKAVWSLQKPWSSTLVETEANLEDDCKIFQGGEENDLAQRKPGKKIKERSRKRRRAYFEHIEDKETQDYETTSARYFVHPQAIYDYFPLAMEHMFGPIHIPDSLTNGETSKFIAFPHNLTFRTADWVDQVIPEDKDMYDIVIAFSISKWIHLNKSDDGLKRFFYKVYDVLTPGGSFILESQPWDSYAKARRMSEELKQAYQNLQLRPDDFPAVLLNEIGFISRHELGRTGEGGFDRSVDIYVKPSLGPRQCP